MFECSKHLPTIFRCYTPTEFALFGIGAIVMGVMLGVVGISWFKHQVCILIEVLLVVELSSILLSPMHVTFCFCPQKIRKAQHQKYATSMIRNFVAKVGVFDMQNSIFP